MSDYSVAMYANDFGVIELVCPWALESGWIPPPTISFCKDGRDIEFRYVGSDET